MARMYKTQDILRKKRRKNYYVDENGNILYEKRNIAGYLDSIETRLDKVIETMIEQNADWSMPQIMRKANVEGVSKKQYSETYRDVIDMIKKYQMGITEKDDDEKDIPNFDTLADEVRKKELHHVYKTSLYLYS